MNRIDIHIKDTMNIETVIIKKEKINGNDINIYDENYNSNNHGDRPNDYFNFIDNCNTCNWVNLFRDEYYPIQITNEKHLIWLKQIVKISCQTGKFSNLFEDELQELLNDYKEYNHLFDGTLYFVRTENVSLKYGQHKIGPYTSFKMIIESLVSCINGHKPIYDNTTEIVIYLFPWINIQSGCEFRVFVYDNNITAISQQNIYENVYHMISDDKIDSYLKIIINSFYDMIQNKIK